MNIKNKLSEYIDTVLLAIGELIVAVLVSLVFLLFGKFSYKVVTGALLGGAVMVMNLFILSLSLNRLLQPRPHLLPLKLPLLSLRRLPQLPKPLPLP